MASNLNSETDLDILVIGAGLSGINTGYLLQQHLPNHRYAILEARDQIGGTWSFFKYPGVRSDSAVALFGYYWHPWVFKARMPDAHLLASYLEDAAATQGIDRKIRLQHRVTACRWSSSDQRWTLNVEVTDGDEVVQKKDFTARWMICCSGYYDYQKPLPTVIPGIEDFGGQVVHPQFWDSTVEYAGKRIVIIGSGATAITLLPNLAKTAKHVTMLQRSPSYVASLPGTDRLIGPLRRWLPDSWARAVNWWWNAFTETAFVFFVQTYPKAAKRLILKGMKAQLPEGFDIQKHFTPSYNVWEQRLCFCPDGDFFKALHKPNTDVVTDTIETVTATGIRTKAGQFLEADMIITATGLLINFLGGLPVLVDDVPVHKTLNDRFVWNSAMLEGVPNSGAVMGYTAGTWTPGADVRTRTLIKVIKQMERSGATSATPYIEAEERKTFTKKPAMNISSTYVVAAVKSLPSVANIGPWRNGARWVVDAARLTFGNVTNGIRYYVPDKKGN